MDKIDNNLLSLKLRSFIAEFRAESVSLWLLCIYILTEFIRPQSMYRVLDFLPWAQLSILLCIVSIFITRSKSSGFGVMGSMMTLFSLFVILSVIFAWSPTASIKYWSTYTSWVLMYFCIVSILTTPNRMFLFIIFFILINFKLSEHGARSFVMRDFSFAHWGLTGSPGWFKNSGELALQMVIIFSMSWSIIVASKNHITNIKRWWLLLLLFPGTAALTVLGSSSRGGQLALVAVILILFLKGKNFFRKILLLTAVIFIGLHFLPAEQLERFNNMGDDGTSQSRLMHWTNAGKTLDRNPLGIGYKNWKFYYYSNFDVPHVEAIHNTVLQAFVELGYHGGILFLLMIIIAFVMNGRTKREMDAIGDNDANTISSIALGINLGLLGTFIAAFFMSVLYYPMFWLAFALTSALRNISKNKVKETSRLTSSSRRTSFSKPKELSTAKNIVS